MSQHPSLKSSGDTKQRSVLKRLERIKKMISKKEWDATDTAFGLPKLKTLKLKAGKKKPQAQENKDAKDTDKKADAK